MVFTRYKKKISVIDEEKIINSVTIERKLDAIYENPPHGEKINVACFVPI